MDGVLYVIKAKGAVSMLRRISPRNLRRCASAHDAPPAPGAYILQVDLAEPLSVKIASRPPTVLPAGRYLYCGSANGPGGLRARLARHARHGKSARWHVDQLTERGAVTGLWFARDGRECDLVKMLAPLPMPVQGFGSSDCARCPSHLLHWPTGAPTPPSLHRSRRACAMLTLGGPA